MPAAEESPLLALLIEDDADDTLLIRNTVSRVRPIPRKILMENARTLGGGFERLDRGGIDVILLDLGLPDGLGLDTLLRTLQHAPHVPVIVLTGLNDEDLALRAIHSGAQDYLIKERINPDLLGRSIRYAVQRHTLMRTIEQHVRQTGEERFRWIVEQMDDSVVIVNRDLVIRFANPPAHVLLNVEVPHLIGRNFPVPPVPGKVREIAIAPEGREPVTAEMHASEIEWGGEPALLVTLRDITIHQRIEESLFRMKKAAEDTVRSDRERRIRLDDELRLSLHTIFDFATLLLQREREHLSAETIESIEAILANGKHIRDLLDNRIEPVRT